MQSDSLSSQNTANEKLSGEISGRFGIHKILAEMLVLRGIDTVEKADRFINSGIKNLHSPFLLENMEKAAEIIEYYIGAGKPIVIYGDYDADGICSVAILYLYFLSRNVAVNWYIPEREEGYGINTDAVDFIIQNYKPGLIISVDCGITAVKEAEYIKGKGVDIIITDHHNSLENLPDCLLVNPKISHDYPFKELCGAGVALKLVQALGGAAEAEKYIDIAAVATVADSVELTGENRDIVTEGLLKLNSRCRKGIKALYEISGFKDGFNTYTIAFGIVPRINAAGRIGEAKRALALFYEDDETVLNELAAELTGANSERQQICEDILKSVKQQVKDTGMIYSHSIAVIDESCHTGVSGIVASKLCEEFHRPSFVFCEIDGMLKGSGRSIEGINIFDMLTSLSGLFERFGGHAYAAGVSLKKENFEKFKRLADEYFKNSLSNRCFTKKQYYDYDLTESKIGPSFIKNLKIFEPCGVGNARPKFKCKVNNLNAQALQNYPKHLSFKLFNTDFMAFNFGNYIDILNSDTENELYFEFQQNIYNGREYSKGYLKDFNYNANSPTLENKIISNCLFQLSFAAKNLPITELYNFNDLPILIKEKKKTFGTLIIADSKQTFDEITRLCPDIEDLKLSVFTEKEGSNISKILLSPDAGYVAEGYENVIFTFTPLSAGYIERFKNAENRVYIPRDRENSTIKTAEYDLSRETFKTYYQMITDKTIMAKPFVNTGNLYYNISMKYGGASLVQFTVCYMVFSELGFISINEETDRLIKNESIKKELESSEIYQKLKYFKYGTKSI